MSKKNHAPRFLQFVQSIQPSVTEISATELKQKLQRHDDFSLLDVREDSEWNEGHIQGAEHLSKGIIERDIEKTVADIHREIVLYCGGGFRSALAAYALQQMGYDNVKSLTGGWSGWLEAES